MFSIGESIFVTENSNGAANSGIIIGNNGVMMVDSTFFPSKANHIVEFISNVSSKTLLYVINTHYHLDHTLGNFAIDAPVVSSEMTKNYLEKIDFERFKSSLEPFIQKELKGVKIVLPSVTFKKQMIFDLGDKKIEILHVGGHTPDSSIVKIWPDGVCFCGDLLFIDYHAEITHESDLNVWIKILKNLRKKDLHYFVPGHGPVGDLESIEEMISYLEKFKALSLMLKSDKADEIIDKFGDEPIFAKRGFPLLFEDSLIDYMRSDDVGKHLSTHKT
jgi:glyoxylase-like metal-dependent hydrolase (beta-lactamase superfamily II)